MYNAQIVCVGDELLSGDTVDQHGSFLARFLTRHGFTVDRISMVSDDYRAILGVLAMAVAQSRLVIVTGGLGPTSDDRTRDALGLLVGQEPEFDEVLWHHIQKTVGRTLHGSNRQQAYRPALFEPLTNACGTAPGLIGEVGGARVVALPGPPVELRSMIEVHGERIVESLASRRQDETAATCFGIPESQLEDGLQAIVARIATEHPSVTDVQWHTRAEPLRIVLRLDGADLKTRDRVVEELKKSFGNERMAGGETTLAETIVAELAARKLKLAAAESCTGGMLGAALTDVAGSSDVFWGSMVTYANSAKSSVLGVAPELLEEHGAVSEQTVVAMARAVRSISGSDLALSISGVAGPDGGTPEKPVGTVWVALDGPGEIAARSFEFAGDRGRVRRAAVTQAFLMIRSKVTLA